MEIDLNEITSKVKSKEDAIEMAENLGKFIYYELRLLSAFTKSIQL